MFKTQIDSVRAALVECGFTGVICDANPHASGQVVLSGRGKLAGKEYELSLIVPRTSSELASAWARSAIASAARISGRSG